MKVIYSVVSAPHPRTQYGHLARTPSGSFFWSADSAKRSHYAILATKALGGAIVGIQKFDVRGSEQNRVILSACATYVWPLYRELGIAQKLWRTSIETFGIKEVSVAVVSDRGKTLVESLRTQFPEIKFRIEDIGGRTLRSLKGSQGSKDHGVREQIVKVA